MTNQNSLEEYKLLAEQSEAELKRSQKNVSDLIDLLATEKESSAKVFKKHNQCEIELDKSERAVDKLVGDLRASKEKTASLLKNNAALEAANGSPKIIPRL